MIIFLVLATLYLYVEIKWAKGVSRGCCITSITRLALGIATLIAFIAVALE